MPEDDKKAKRIQAYWRERLAAASSPELISRDDIELQTSQARYSLVTYRVRDGELLQARYIVPRRLETAPCVIDLYDGRRGPRGWHHLTRWIALGCAVLQPIYRVWSEDITEGWQKGPDGLVLNRIIEDIYAACEMADMLPECTGQKHLLYGEGFGAAVGLSVAAFTEARGKPFEAISVLNPYPTDVSAVWEKSTCEGMLYGITRYFRERDPLAKSAEELFDVLAYADPISVVAKLHTSSVLFGTSRMDRCAVPYTQDRLCHALLCPHRQLMYPKWEHERVNDFEDQTLVFFQPFLSL